MSPKLHVTSELACESLSCGCPHQHMVPLIRSSLFPLMIFVTRDVSFSTDLVSFSTNFAVWKTYIFFSCSVCLSKMYYLLSFLHFKYICVKINHKEELFIIRLDILINYIYKLLEHPFNHLERLFKQTPMLVVPCIGC